MHLEASESCPSLPSEALMNAAFEVFLRHPRVRQLADQLKLADFWCHVVGGGEFRNPVGVVEHYSDVKVEFKHNNCMFYGVVIPTLIIRVWNVE